MGNWVGWMEEFWDCTGASVKVHCCHFPPLRIQELFLTFLAQGMDTMWYNTMCSSTGGDCTRINRLPLSDLVLQFEFECRARGADILAYPPVVAGGNRSNTLHYVKNNQLIKVNHTSFKCLNCTVWYCTKKLSGPWQSVAPARDDHSRVHGPGQISLCKAWTRGGGQGEWQDVKVAWHSRLNSVGPKAVSLILHPSGMALAPALSLLVKREAETLGRVNLMKMVLLPHHSPTEL